MGRTPRPAGRAQPGPRPGPGPWAGDVGMAAPAQPQPSLLAVGEAGGGVPAGLLATATGPAGPGQLHQGPSAPGAPPTRTQWPGRSPPSFPWDTGESGPPARPSSPGCCPSRRGEGSGWVGVWDDAERVSQGRLISAGAVFRTEVHLVPIGLRKMLVPTVPLPTCWLPQPSRGQGEGRGLPLLSEGRVLVAGAGMGVPFTPALWGTPCTRQHVPAQCGVGCRAVTEGSGLCGGKGGLRGQGDSDASPGPGDQHPEQSWKSSWKR